MENLIHGLGDLGTWSAIIYLLAGAVIGVVVGVIPGLGTPVVLSIILIFVYHIDITGTLCLFLGAQCGSFYAASVSAILLNTPAHPEAFPITFDGYPMARKGQPGRALGLSACSTCVGGLIGCGVLIGFLQLIDDIPGVFKPPEYVALVALAMLLVGTLQTDSIRKTIASAGVGLVLASIGPDDVTGVYRYTFNNPDLVNGVSLVALVLGVFAIPQMIMLFGTGTATTTQDLAGREMEAAEPVEIGKGYSRQVFGGVIETFRHWGVLLQSGIVGGVTGMIPGIGGFTGNFMAYGIARQLSRKRKEFGTGIPEGIIAPEGSSLAKEAGHIIPLLGLGIPGGISGALFIGALALKNIRIGYGFQSAYPNVTGEIVWIIAITGIVGTLLGVLFGAQIAKVTRVPGPLIVPFVVALCIVGPFFGDPQFFVVMELLVFSLVGLVFRRLSYPLGPFVMGVVLGPTLEENINFTRGIYPGVSFIGHRPIADILFVLCLVVLVSKTLEIRRAASAKRATIVERLAEAGQQPTRAQVRHEQTHNSAGYPVLSLIATLLLLGSSLFLVIYGVENYSFTTVVMPLIGGLCIAVPSALFLPRDVQRFLVHLSARRRSIDATSSSPVGGTSMQQEAVVPSAVGASSEGEVAVGSQVVATLVELAAPTTSSSEVVGAPTMTRDDGLSPIIGKSWGPNGQYRREVIAFAIVCAAVGLCWLFGFTTGGTAFVVGYGLICTRRYLRSLRSRLIFTVFAGAATFAALYEMFHLAYLPFTPKIHI